MSTPDALLTAAQTAARPLGLSVLGIDIASRGVLSLALADRHDGYQTRLAQLRPDGAVTLAPLGFSRADADAAIAGMHGEGAAIRAAHAA